MTWHSTFNREPRGQYVPIDKNLLNKYANSITLMGVVLQFQKSWRQITEENQAILIPRGQHHCWQQLRDVFQSSETAVQQQTCLRCCTGKQHSSSILLDHFYTDITRFFNSSNYITTCYFKVKFLFFPYLTEKDFYKQSYISQFTAKWELFQPHSSWLKFTLQQQITNVST